MRQVKFSRLVMSPVYGNCGPGDVVRCDDLFARHVVEELDCAVYVDAPAEVAAPDSFKDEPQPAPAARRAKRKG